jgi:hypothetical protein
MYYNQFKRIVGELEEKVIYLKEKKKKRIKERIKKGRP